MEFQKFPTLLAAILAAQLTSLYSEAPPPNLGRPYELATDKNLTIDQIITKAYGSINEAANSMLSPDGKVLAELDMLLTQEQFIAMYEPPKESEMKRMQMYPPPLGSPVNDENYSYETKYGVRSKRKATQDPRRRWTNNICPYTFTKGHFNDHEEYLMRRAMTEWERYTCLKFTPATRSDRNVIRFQGGAGCNSQLGMVGGVQDLNLESPGCRYKGLYLHEIGHAIGLVHEHQLPDRDNYISINYRNVEPHMRIWFNKYTSREVNQMDVEYEYSSVMHYGVTAFSYDGKAQTISAPTKAKEEQIGKVYLKELAYSDVEIVNAMYKCAGHCPNPNKCGKDGHLDQNCNCICKDGSSDTCDTTKNSNSNCRNQHDSWKCYIWARQGECERSQVWMETNCRKACKVCGNQDQTQCKDNFEDKCKLWKSRGDCVTNRSWMKANCGQTCKLCPGGVHPEEQCSNTHPEAAEKCFGWSMDGECIINKGWMFTNCRKSCRFCSGDGGTTDPTDETGGACKDTNENCAAWASSGECENNPGWMLVNCQKSCKRCTVTPVTGPPTERPTTPATKKPVTEATPSPVTGATPTSKRPVTTTGTGECKNKHKSNQQCENWAQNDQCDINPDWMHPNCAKSCGRCTTGGDKTTTDSTGGGQRGCTDSSTSCASWAKSGYCDTNPSYNLKYCKKSCNNCNGCRDTQSMCVMWASANHCNSNPSYMLRHCQKSCNVCQTVTRGHMSPQNSNAPGHNVSSPIYTVISLLCFLLSIVML